jgi:phenylpyruvate tautomerase PptA (4-oxalocrotonate tautomerase family)
MFVEEIVDIFDDSVYTIRIYLRMLKEEPLSELIKKISDSIKKIMQYHHASAVVTIQSCPPSTILTTGQQYPPSPLTTITDEYTDVLETILSVNTDTTMTTEE